MIRPSADLADAGRGVRFSVERGAETLAAFAVRFGGRVYAYLNECVHARLELDWMPGEFFDAAGLYLLCSAHGALYEPESGRCRGGALVSLPVEERDGRVLLKESLVHA